MDKIPKPGISYSSALNSSVAPPLVQKSLQTPQLQTITIRNTSASPAIVNPAVDNDTITIKKSDWLAISSSYLLPFLNLAADNDLYNSDHFPLIITDNRHNPTNSYRSPKYVLNAGN
ncbi:hypothetical protein AVEN_42930-1 [Araneus ventricosus]|uniref:Endonuclease/exonuclease/phosphatase domain-containing protein n=1 Tax=Araneus ventricosus TaxID=182803 RepID=A0A4Y2AGN0_ARAVE|nr:hypothetical protein AVEN_42930-1 [Araneus ventricosus]